MKRSTAKRLVIASLLAASAYLVVQPAALAHVLKIVRVSNPNWYIELTDFGYADVAADVTGGGLRPLYFREYLSGEWAAAISDKSSRKATWFEPRFEFPDWNTNSNFTVVSALVPRDADGNGVADRNASGQIIYTSTIRNNKFLIQMTYEFINTRRGIAQGDRPAATPVNPGSRVISNKWVLKQTYKITNVTSTRLRDVRLYQFLHGLHSTRAVFDNRDYREKSRCAGVKCRTYRYDITLRGVVRAFVDLQRPFENVPGQPTRETDVSSLFGFVPAIDDAFFKSLLGKNAAGVEAAFQDINVTLTPRSRYADIARSEFYVVNRDTIAFHSQRKPIGVANVNQKPHGYEVGRYGVQSKGHSHVQGKPREGVHLSVEKKKLKGRTLFDPGNLWVSGAEAWKLGDLPPGGMVTMDVLLSISTSQQRTRQ
jgi:hypothetical protein